ncbi:hypothetical protein MAL1_00184 [Bacteriophage DSS3_MAL1]|nr:hypothetical protein MAL1_00184 [Bacteriophage DSS3_MAL1]
MQRRSRHTIESTRDLIAELRDQDPVYKTDVDRAKDVLNRAFEADWDIVRHTKHLDDPRSRALDSDNKLYFAAPYEVRHWYGKKFSKFLDELPCSEFRDATISHRNRWRPLFNALQDLIKRQVKGRKPVEKKVVGTRTQLRAICPCCFKQHAVKGDRLVAHGYTLDHGFQNGTCQGAGKPHFGTAAGLQTTRDFAADLAGHMSNISMRADNIEKGLSTPTLRDRKGKAIEHPTPRQIAAYIDTLRYQVRGIEHTLEELDKRVEGWKPAAAVEVEVEITE